MRKPRKFIVGNSDGRGKYFHVVSRTAGQEILFDAAEKETFTKILFKQVKFSGVRLLAWCFMGNHFHLLLEVPDKEVALADFTEEDLIDRLAVFRDEHSTRLLLGEVAMFRSNGHAAGVTAIAERVRARLFDLSVFMKELKQKFSIAYNHQHDRKGTLWEGRFKCMLVGEGEGLRAVAAYIDLNPIRAGLVKRPEQYRWCSYAAAVSGMRLARRGLTTAIEGNGSVAGRTTSTWAKASSFYRELLYGKGQAVAGGVTKDGYEKSKGGFTQAEIEAVWAGGGKLTLAQVLRCRVRYFTDGAVLGSKQFVDDFFDERREFFGEKRETGARAMKGANWGTLRVLRALRTEAVVLSARE